MDQSQKRPILPYKIKKHKTYHANKELSQQCLYAAITRVTVESISTSNDVKILWNCRSKSQASTCYHHTFSWPPKFLCSLHVKTRSPPNLLSLHTMKVILVNGRELEMQLNMQSTGCNHNQFSSLISHASCSSHLTDIPFKNLLHSKALANSFAGHSIYGPAAFVRSLLPRRI